MVKLALAMSLHLHHSMCDGIDQSMLGEFDTHHDNEKNLCVKWREFRCLFEHRDGIMTNCGKFNDHLDNENELAGMVWREFRCLLEHRDGVMINGGKFNAASFNMAGNSIPIGTMKSS